MVQQDTEVPGSTTLGDAEAPGAAPLRLQDHGHPVRYRNIWLEQIDAGTEPGPDAGTTPGGGTDGGVGPDGGSDAGP